MLAFDLLYCDGEDLRSLPLIDRKNGLDALLSTPANPSLSYVAPHPDGARLFTTMDELGLEGVVAKRSASPYRSGPARRVGEGEVPDVVGREPGAGVRKLTIRGGSRNRLARSSSAVGAGDLYLLAGCLMHKSDEES